METTTSDHAADIDRHVRVYITVFASLMVLTIVTVAVSRFHLPVPVAVTVALLVATIKGSLVACYFMHLMSLPFLTVNDGFWIRG
jgi:cytochrome c oxidase subunit 4